MFSQAMAGMLVLVFVPVLYGISLVYGALGTLDLQQIRDQSVGGTAAGLARLSRIGLPVPPGFVPAVEGTPEKRREMLSGYFTAVTAMDAGVGRLLDVPHVAAGAAQGRQARAGPQRRQHRVTRRAPGARRRPWSCCGTRRASCR
mgnify:CR=1 FL=1